MSHDVTNFQAEVIERSRSLPVLVDFWAAWCGPCRMLGPVLEKLAGEAGGRWALAKLDTEAHPEIAERYQIMSIPNVKLFVDGRVVDEFLGALPESEVRRWLERALPSPARERVAEAGRLIERGRFREAEALLAAAPTEEARDPMARLLLAEARLHTDPARVEETLHGLEDDPEIGDRAEALRALGTLVAHLERPEALPDAPARARFLAGLEAVRAGDWAIAMEAFIEVLRTDRGYAGGAARDAGRAIFRWLGWEHPVSEQYHRAFSSAVNV